MGPHPAVAEVRRAVRAALPTEGRGLVACSGGADSLAQAACDALGLTPWHDPHNADPAYQRVRLRRDVLPLLEDVLHGGVAEALARTAALTQADLDALDALAAGISRDSATLDVAALKSQPQAIRTRVLRAWALVGGAAPLTATHIAALDALVAQPRTSTEE